VIVMKFGGSSLADLDEIRRALEIVRTQKESHPVVVVSALGDITDVLERFAYQSLENDEKYIVNAVNNYFEPRLYRIVHGVVTHDIEQRQCLTEVNRLLQELKNIYRGLTLVRELTPRALDTVLSYGERFSRIIISHGLSSSGVRTSQVSAGDCMITDSGFGNARIDWEKAPERIRECLQPELDKGNVPVLEGFVGGTPDGAITTLGRGGSDYSAAVAGAVLGAEEIQIWTDVDGFLTADPAIVPDAETIPKLNINEAREMAQFGARILHPKTVLPAIDRDIPVYIRNTFQPEKPGTLLSNAHGESGIHGITSVRDLCILTVDDNRGNRLLSPAYEQVIDPSAFCVAYTTPICDTIITTQPNRDALHANLPKEALIQSRGDIGIITLIGEGLGVQTEEFHLLLELMADYDCDIFTASPRRNRWLLTVNDFEVEEIIQNIYTALFQQDITEARA